MALLDLQQLPGEPPGLIGEPGVLREGTETLVAGGDVEADAVLELAQVNGAELQRPGVALGEVVRAVHQARVEHAVGDAEQMGGLVRQHLA